MTSSPKLKDSGRSRQSHAVLDLQHREMNRVFALTRWCRHVAKKQGFQEGSGDACAADSFDASFGCGDELTRLSQGVSRERRRTNLVCELSRTDHSSRNRDPALMTPKCAVLVALGVS